MAEYKLVTWVIHPIISGVIALLITGKGPPKWMNFIGCPTNECGPDTEVEVPKTQLVFLSFVAHQFEPTQQCVVVLLCFPIASLLSQL